MIQTGSFWCVLRSASLNRKRGIYGVVSGCSVEGSCKVIIGHDRFKSLNCICISP
jgi:hypothetical protein